MHAVKQTPRAIALLARANTDPRLRLGTLKASLCSSHGLDAQAWAITHAGAILDDELPLHALDGEQLHLIPAMHVAFSDAYAVFESLELEEQRAITGVYVNACIFSDDRGKGGARAHSHRKAARRFGSMMNRKEIRVWR